MTIGPGVWAHQIGKSKKLQYDFQLAPISISLGYGKSPSYLRIFKTHSFNLSQRSNSTG